MKKIRRWYNETSAIKRAYEAGKIDRKWVENYCWNNGEGCVRKKGFEEVSPAYVMLDGSVDEKLIEDKY